jgi:hypothetical protein
MARRTPRRSGDLSDLCIVVWATIKYLSATIENDVVPREMHLRACSAMAANAGVYRQLLETSDLEKRLTALETRVALAVRR